MSRTSAAWSDMIVLTMARASRMLFVSPTNRFFSATQSISARTGRATTPVSQLTGGPPRNSGVTT